MKVPYASAVASLIYAMVCTQADNNSLLETCQISSIPNGPEDGPEYDVADIFDSKIVRNKLYYLVDWLGYSPSDCTWELVQNVGALLEAFHRQYLDKPSPQLKTTRNIRCLKRRIVS